MTPASMFLTVAFVTNRVMAPGNAVDWFYIESCSSFALFPG